MSESESGSETEMERQSEYDRMLAELDFAIEEIREKVEDGRIRPEHDRVRVQHYRAIGYLIRTRADILEKRELEELAERIEALEGGGSEGTEPLLS